MEMNKSIIEFEKGERVQGFYLIKTVDCKTTNNSNTNKYLDFTLADRTGEINAKLWECTEEIEAAYKDHMLVKVRGTVHEFRGKLQLKIDIIRLANKEDEVSIEDFVPVAPYAPEVMYNEVLQYIHSMSNEQIQKLVLHIVEQHKEEFMHYPAAKSNHHAIRSGLLYHITTMLKAGEKLSQIYTFVNNDLLYAGIILHDIAKIHEMDASELGIVREYTIEGQLLGHIIQGIKLVEIAGKDTNCDPEVIMLLQHMILSHHYEPEYGSPKRPMIPEAELLHHLDIMDARMYDMKKALGEIEAGKLSDRIWSLNNINVYKSVLGKE